MTSMTTTHGSRRSRRWCFTINNPTPLDDPNQWPYRYVVWQKEEGDSHTPHLQGFVVWHQGIDLRECKLYNTRAHWEIARGTLDENIKYCTKTEGQLAGPWIRGRKPTPGKRNDLHDVCDMIVGQEKMFTISMAFPSQFVRYFKGMYELQMQVRGSTRQAPDIWIFHGPSGIGKTKLVSEVYPEAFWKPKGSWWDGYDGEEVVIIDEFYSWLSLDLLLRLLDRYPLLVEKKGGTLRMLATTFVFTSNVPPTEWYGNLPVRRTEALWRRLREYGHIYGWDNLTSEFKIEQL